MTSRYALTARTAAETRLLGRVEDALANFAVTADDYGDALDLAAFVARTNQKTAYVSTSGSWPGCTTRDLVTAYEPAGWHTRVRPTGFVTTSPDGRPEYLPACPVGQSNPAPRGRITARLDRSAFTAVGTLTIDTREG